FLPYGELWREGSSSPTPCIPKYPSKQKSHVPGTISSIPTRITGHAGSQPPHIHRPISLSARQAPVHQNLDLHPSVLGTSLGSFVGGGRSRSTHGAGCHNVPDGNIAVLDQERNDFLCAIHTQFLIHGGVA